MATKIECDRCGKQLANSNATWLRGSYHVMPSQAERALDLCSDCRKSFQQWLQDSPE